MQFCDQIFDQTTIKKILYLSFLVTQFYLQFINVHITQIRTKKCEIQTHTYATNFNILPSLLQVAHAQNKQKQNHNV